MKSECDCGDCEFKGKCFLEDKKDKPKTLDDYKEVTLLVLNASLKDCEKTLATIKKDILRVREAKTKIDIMYILSEDVPESKSIHDFLKIIRGTKE